MNFISEFLKEDNETQTPEGKEKDIPTSDAPETTGDDTNIEEEKSNPDTGSNNDAANDGDDPQRSSDTPPDNNSDDDNKGKQGINEADILSFLNKKYEASFESIDDAFKPKETTIDPLDGLSDEAKSFLKYAKETNRGINDFLSLKKDYTKISPLDLAREKAIKESNGQLSSQDVDEYLQRKLGVSIDEENLDKFDVIELNNYSKDYLNKKLEEQKKFSSPLANDAPKKDVVKLNDGREIPVEQYDKIKKARQNYLESLKEASDHIKAADFSIDFDNNGDKQTLGLSYEYSKDDKHNMVSDASDVDKTFARLFKSEDGKVNSKELQEGLFWANPENRPRAISAIVNKAIAQFLDNHMEEKNNYKVETKQAPRNGNSKNKTVPIPGTKNNFGVKYDFS